MARKEEIIEVTKETEIEVTSVTVSSLIHIIRGKQVILDSDLAMLYQVETGAMNRAVKRNKKRFPEDFCFQLTEEEFLRCQNGISKDKGTDGRGGRRYMPYAFTEQGISMLSAILRSDVAINVSIGIMRAFVEMRKFLATNSLILNRVDELEVKQLEYQKSTDAAESADKVLARFDQPWTTYYFIMADDEKVGLIRVVDKKDGSRKRISPIWIMPKYRNKGYAQQAILAAEKIYGSDHWCLDTILQEEGNLHLYEKLGYHQTGRVDKINDRMDIVFYEKDENRQMDYSIKKVTIDDYDAIYELWNSTEQSRRALNPVDDSREGIARYLKRNPDTCFAAVKDGKIIGVILTGHDGRRAIVHHLCVHPDYRRMGIAGHLVSLAEEALQKEGIQKIFGLVFKDNEAANVFWEQQGYSLRTNLNYRNKSLNDQIPTGE